MERCTKWTNEEEEALRRLIAEHGITKRSLIARSLIATTSPNRKESGIIGKIRQIQLKEIPIENAYYEPTFNLDDIHKIYGIHTTRLRQFIKEGRLPARKIGAEYEVDICVVDALNDSLEWTGIGNKVNWAYFDDQIGDLCYACV